MSSGPLKIIARRSKAKPLASMIFVLAGTALAFWLKVSALLRPGGEGELVWAVLFGMLFLGAIVLGALKVPDLLRRGGQPTVWMQADGVHLDGRSRPVPLSEIAAVRYLPPSFWRLLFTGDEMALLGSVVIVRPTGALEEFMTGQMEGGCRDIAERLHAAVAETGRVLPPVSKYR